MNRSTRSRRVQSLIRKTLLAAAATAAPALAVDRSWLVANGNWGTVNNWNPLGAPTVADNVVIGNSAAAENAWVTMNVNGGAASLVMNDGMTLDTDGQMLTVVGLTSLSGRNSPGNGVVYSTRLVVDNGVNAYDFRTTNLTISDEARLWLEGGTTRVDGVLDLQDTAWIYGNGVINLYGNAAVALRNNGRLDPKPGGLTLNQLGTGRIDLDGTVADDALINITTATIDGSPFASLTINGTGLLDDYNERFWLAGGNTLAMNLTEGWTLGTGGEIEVFAPLVGSADAVVSGGTATIAGHLRVRQDAVASFQSHAVLAAGATGSISTGGRLAFGAAASVNGGSFGVGQGGTISFDGSTTVQAGTFATATDSPADGMVVFNGPTNWRGEVTFNGVGRQSGNATVSLATIINADTFDMDGLGGNTSWTINAPLQVNADRINGVSNSFYGNMTVNAANLLAPASLEINTPASGAWFLSGTLTVNGPGAGFAAETLRGSTVDVTGAAIVNGSNIFSAKMNVLDGGTVTVNSGASLRLDGGTLGVTNRILGGRIIGPGTLRANPGHAVSGYGTIATSIDFDGSAEVRADGGILRVTGPILDVGVIGTSGADGVLNVSSPWNTGVAERVELLGGQVTGAAITNDGHITGHGFVFPTSLTNSGSISAVGAELVINAATNIIDLDGNENGRLNAVGANLTIADAPTDAFDGRALVGAGRTLSLVNGWNVGSGGTVELGGLPGNPATLAGTAQNFAGGAVITGPAVFDILTRFNPTARVETSAAVDSLLLTGQSYVEAGAAFSGPGELRNATSGTLQLEDSSAVGVTLVNSGILTIEDGISTGLASAQRYQQTINGVTRMHMGGPVPGLQYDRLNVATTASLGGKLQLSLTGGYDPAYLTYHELLRADSVSGMFDGVAGNVISPTKYLAVVYDADSVLVTAALPGDANLDGNVNLDDFTTVAAYFGNAGPWVNGNFNGDGRVDLDDFTALAANFGTSVPAGLPRATAVPEPSVWWLTAPPIAAVLLGRGRRRRHSGQTL